MSVFDPFHHDHINTPLITVFELQMVGGCRMKTGGVITPWRGLDKSLGYNANNSVWQIP